MNLVLIALLIIDGVCALKYGFVRLAATAFIIGVVISERLIVMAPRVASQWITLTALSLPFCRLPISRVGTPNDATSTIPLELLPMTPSESATAER